MTPDELWIDMARFDGAHANRIWDGSAATDDAPAWYGRVATLLRAAAAPATEDELAGESDIVGRMQAAILELPPQASNDDAGDSDRPRHLRAAGSSDAARRRQGVRVVRRIVAVKAAAVTTVVAIGVTAAAATTGFVATVVVPALSTHDEKTLPKPEPSATEDSGSSTDGPGDAERGAGDGVDDGPFVMDPDAPLVCMLDLDCLLQEVEEAAAAPTAEADASAKGDEGTAESGLATDVTVPSQTPTETTLATDAPTETSTTTTTEPPTTTTEPPTTTTEPPTTTTEPPTDTPAGDAAAPVSADTSSDTGRGATAAAAHHASRPSPAR